MAAAKSKKLRWQLVAVIYVTSLFYFLFQGGKTAFMLYMILNLLLVYLVLGRWSGINRVSGSRTYTVPSANALEQSLSAGSSLDVTLSMKIPGYYPLPYVIVRDQMQRHNGQKLAFESSFVPNWKRSGQVVYQTPPLQRGEYRFMHTQCLSYDVFGLFEHSGQFGTETVFNVLPQTVPLRQWNGIQRGIRGPYSHAIASRSAKETTQINGVREYLYGDRLSRVHWNATAKTGEWKSKAFERESLPRTIVILDRYAGGYALELATRFELAVSAAASLLENGLKDDTAMGLLSIGDKLTMISPKSGIEQRNIMMKHLTFVDADAVRPLYSSLQQADTILEPGSFAVVITPDTGADVIKSMEWLSRKGITPCLLHISSAVDKLSGNTSWKNVMRERGWPVFEIRQLQELPTVLEGSGIA
ncbi:uncharacterized protein (DUF58 family) [Paenibacillus endophyticus]|uniref:Uncharacterized protein (DUF58 family) n=1 Tax=Paenibacillus endophyticus TaxID=1294268 RepID=A0A7W5GBM6_9BACL|nr:DUF58 domain-containing protein [Paenibacillus endophyticus]MBB3153087.1 uncharacterized protein (DUF58 family) [Paenibacillus endophyticus]